MDVFAGDNSTDKAKGKPVHCMVLLVLVLLVLVLLIKIQTLQNYCNSTQTLHREVSRMSSSFVELIKTSSLSFTLDQSILGNFAFNTFNGKKRNKQ